ncbi:MAG: T9SS type A sorting domain-containing protein, partial [Chitinophagales bacterium]|nr:T9SS type A sorting domain-containing protein [Chitinophagales bacterium]
HHHHPTVSTTADEALFIVDVVDTVSRLTCLERSDTVVVKTYTCYPNQLNIPTIIKSGVQPYLIIPNLPANTAVQVYNAAGQLMYESNSYQNNWHIGNVAAGIYAIRTRMSNGTEQRSKVVVVD